MRGGVRARMQDAGSRMQDPGCRIQDPGSRMQDPGCRIQDAGSKMQDPRCRIQDAQQRSSTMQCGGASILYLASCILHPASCILHLASCINPCALPRPPAKNRQNSRCCFPFVGVSGRLLAWLRGTSAGSAFLSARSAGVGKCRVDGPVWVLPCRWNSGTRQLSKSCSFLPPVRPDGCSAGSLPAERGSLWQAVKDGLRKRSSPWRGRSSNIRSWS